MRTDQFDGTLEVIVVLILITVVPTLFRLHLSAGYHRRVGDSPVYGTGFSVCPWGGLRHKQFMLYVYSYYVNNYCDIFVWLEL